MAATDTTRALTAADAARCLPLSDEAGWNQTAADWAMMLERGHVTAVETGTGAVLATALALPMGGGIGWISMVLVTASMRRQGVAQRLTGASIAWLEARGLTPHLDATPAGQPLYRRLGFAPVCGLTRMAGPGGAGQGCPPADAAGPAIAGPGGDGTVRAARAADLDWIAALDEEVFGGDRAPILRDLMTRPGALALVRDDRTGFLLSRRGRTATQIGPVVATDPDAALALLTTALGAISGPVLIDCFDAHSPVRGMLEGRGFAPQRPFLRMVRGPVVARGDARNHFVAAGPELG